MTATPPMTALAMLHNDSASLPHIVLRHPSGDFSRAVAVENSERPTRMEACELALTLKAESPTLEFSVAVVILTAAPVAVPFEMIEPKKGLKP